MTKAQKKEIRQLITVGDLIKYLNVFDKSLPVGFVDHFGCFENLYLSNIYKRRTNIYKTEIEFDAIVFPVIDIGEEPD